FYTHFAGKEAVLLSGFDDLREHLRASPRRLRGLIEHVLENRRLFRAIAGKRAGQLAVAHFRRFVFDLVRDDLGQSVAEPVARFVSGGISDLLIWAVDARPAPEADELEATCVELCERVTLTRRSDRQARRGPG